MHQTRETSKIAFKEEVLPTLSARQEQCLYALRILKEATNNEIAHYLGIEEHPINTVCSRTNELVKLGRVQEKMRRPDMYTGRRSIVWEIADGGKQLSIL